MNLTRTVGTMCEEAGLPGGKKPHNYSKNMLTPRNHAKYRSKSPSPDCGYCSEIHSDPLISLWVCEFGEAECSHLPLICKHIMHKPETHAGTVSLCTCWCTMSPVGVQRTHSGTLFFFGGFFVCILKNWTAHTTPTVSVQTVGGEPVSNQSTFPNAPREADRPACQPIRRSQSNCSTYCS